MDIEILPTSIEEALELLKTFYKKDIEKIKSLSEKEFRGSSHFGAGMFIRNNWYLWWYKNHEHDSWPKKRPTLNKWFNSVGIYHADDMSGILLTSLYRSLKGQDLRLEEQIQYYIDYWKKQGFKDGNPMR